MKDKANKARMLIITMMLSALIFVGLGTGNASAETGADAWNDMVAYGTAGAIIFIVAAFFVYMIWGREGTNKGGFQAVAFILLIIGLLIGAGVTISETGAFASDTTPPITDTTQWLTVPAAANDTALCVQSTPNTYTFYARYNTTSNEVSAANNSIVLTFTVGRVGDGTVYKTTHVTMGSIGSVSVGDLTYPVIAKDSFNRNMAVFTDSESQTHIDDVLVPESSTKESPTTETITLTLTVNNAYFENAALGSVIPVLINAPDQVITFNVIYLEQYS